MHFITEQIGTITQVKITGRIDALSAGDLEIFLFELLNSEKIHLVIDCSEVIFLSSAGMRVFLAVMDIIQKRKGILFFCGFKARIEEVIRLTGLSKNFIQYASLDEAMQGMQALIHDVKTEE